MGLFFSKVSLKPPKISLRLGLFLIEELSSVEELFIKFLGTSTSKDFILNSFSDFGSKIEEEIFIIWSAASLNADSIFSPTLINIS